MGRCSVDGEADEELLNVVTSGTCKRNALIFNLHSYASNPYHNNYLVTAHRSPLAVCTFTFIFKTIQMTVRRPPVRASPSVTVTNSSHSRRVYAVVTQIIVKASRSESMEQANFFGIGVI